MACEGLSLEARLLSCLAVNGVPRSSLFLFADGRSGFLKTRSLARPSNLETSMAIHIWRVVQKSFRYWLEVDHFSR